MYCIRMCKQWDMIDIVFSCEQKDFCLAGTTAFTKVYRKYTHRQSLYTHRARVLISVRLNELDHNNE